MTSKYAFLFSIIVGLTLALSPIAANATPPQFEESVEVEKYLRSVTKKVWETVPMKVNSRNTLSKALAVFADGLDVNTPSGEEYFSDWSVSVIRIPGKSGLEAAPFSVDLIYNSIPYYFVVTFSDYGFKIDQIYDDVTRRAQELTSSTSQQ